MVGNYCHTPALHLSEHMQQLDGVTGPFAVAGLQQGEQHLELFDCDAVAGQHTQHVHQQV